jgi:hypothetical protein
LKLRGLFVAVAALATLGGCAWQKEVLPPLAHARVTADFDSYQLRRVGLLPFSGDGLDRAQSEELQRAFLFELSRRASYEVVRLAPEDLAEVDAQQPYERGTYRSKSVIETARRFHLDGLLVGTVTHLESYAPQALGVQVELVASETGLVIWSSALELDMTDAGVRDSLRQYSEEHRDENDEPADERLMLLSPLRLMRFAASEVARTL